MSSIQTSYNILRAAGLTRASCLGFLGNWQAESGNEPNRLQGDFSSYRTSSKDYTSRVQNGSISRQQFGTDQKGYGLAQWTYYSRKYELYDYWKKSGKALDDVALQTEFALIELKRDFSTLYSFLCTCNDLYTATKEICCKFERPAWNNVDARFRYAQEIEPMVVDGNSSDDSVPSGGDEQPTPLRKKNWPPRMLCKGMEGPDVVALKGLLHAHGYYDGDMDEKYNQDVDASVTLLQLENNLIVDGIAGNQVFTYLTQFSGVQR